MSKYIHKFLGYFFLKQRGVVPISFPRARIWITLLLCCHFSTLLVGQEKSNQNKEPMNPLLLDSPYESYILKENLPQLTIDTTRLYENPENEDLYILRRLKKDTRPENPYRRGEIIFFPTFIYVFSYQLLFLDILFPSIFSELAFSSELSLPNLIFSISVAILGATMVTQKDYQFIDFMTQYQNAGPSFCYHLGYQKDYNCKGSQGSGYSGMRISAQIASFSFHTLPKKKKPKHPFLHETLSSPKKKKGKSA